MNGFAYKWVLDALVEQGWFKDDNQITLVLEPVTVEKHRVETEIEVTVYGECK